MGFDVGQIHMARCVVEFEPTTRPPLRVVAWDILDLGSGTIARSVETLTALVRTAERSDSDDWKAEHIVIEQQDRINTKMVALSHALQATLLLHNEPNTYIGFASSAKKFSVFESMPGVVDTVLFREPKTQPAAKRKRVRKQNSINIADALFRALPETAEHEALYRKFQTIDAGMRDDLADALVYAIAYVYKNEDALPPPEKHRKRDAAQRTLTFY
jgi:hypothetical protein